MSVASLRYLSSGSTHLFDDVERVVHRVGRVRRVGRRLRREVEQRLLPDLPRRHLLEAQLDAGERLELRLQRDQVLEVARRDDGDGDRLAFDLLPVDLGGAIRREVVGLGEARAGRARSPMPPRRRARRLATAPRGAWDGCSWASPVADVDGMTIAAARPRPASGAPSAFAHRCLSDGTATALRSRCGTLLARRAAPQHFRLAEEPDPCNWKS